MCNTDFVVMVVKTFLIEKHVELIYDIKKVCVRKILHHLYCCTVCFVVFCLSVLLLQIIILLPSDSWKRPQGYHYHRQS